MPPSARRVWTTRRVGERRCYCLPPMGREYRSESQQTGQNSYRQGSLARSLVRSAMLHQEPTRTTCSFRGVGGQAHYQADTRLDWSQSTSERLRECPSFSDRYHGTMPRPLGTVRRSTKTIPWRSSSHDRALHQHPDVPIHSGHAAGLDTGQARPLASIQRKGRSAQPHDHI